MSILTPAAIRAVASAAGFTDDPAAQDLTISVAVALAESAGKTDAINTANTNGTRDYGLWQINSVHADLFKSAVWSDPAQNARMAFAVFKGAGYRWSPWSTFNNGAYKRFMGVAAASGQRGLFVTVNPGDTLSHIAQVQLGDATKWPLIWHAPQNAALVQLRLIPEHLQPGDKLYVPLP